MRQTARTATPHTPAANCCTPSGWDGFVDDPDELAAAMAAETVEGAAEHAVGTRLHPRFDHETAEWSYTPQ